MTVKEWITNSKKDCTVYRKSDKTCVNPQMVLDEKVLGMRMERIHNDKHMNVILQVR